MFTRKRFNLFTRVLILILITTTHCYAQDFREFSSTEILDAYTTNSTLQHITANLETAGTTDVDPFSYISINIMENTAPFTAYKFSLTLQVTPILPDGTPDGSSYSLVLDLENNRNANSGNSINLKQHILESKYGAVINIVSSTFEDIENNLAPVINGPIPANIILTIGFQTKRYYELPQSMPIVNALMLNNELELSWIGIPEARYYDVEWTWVDNYGAIKDVALNSNQIYFSTKDIERNSTRIQTDQTGYNIPLIYSRGFLIYRVRAVGNFLADLSKNKYGPWSSGSDIKNLVSDWTYYTISGDYEDTKNWQFQASYAEDGKKKEVVSYFDGSLRNRQTVTNINTDQNAIVGEVIYDAQGRPAIEVLPVPINEKTIKYYSNFNTNTAGAFYNFNDFDKDTQNEVDLTSNDKLMNIISGASNYYSASNTFTDVFKDRIPDAEQYPFSQIEYTPDNTGRIRRKSGVGAAHQLGSTHEMEYYYSVPEQKELNRLFGYSVGNSSHYKKNMVKDPNGQLSVSYIDPQGRTIATALAGYSPQNLTGLDDESDTSGLHAIVSTDLLGKIMRTDTDTFIDNNQLGVTGKFGALNNQLSYTAIKTAVFDESRTFNYTLSNTNPYFNFGCVT
ncbi:MAG: hypothetical protein CVU08_10140, partial [Bacteroidetes bacterium HGW-Bacteroidetes-3]